MFHHVNTFTRKAFGSQTHRRKKSWTSGISPRKVLRLAIVLVMSFLCWIGLGCFAFEMLQLAGH
jgi:hypothetical protein